jgi:hypothetical protein
MFGLPYKIFNHYNCSKCQKSISVKDSSGYSHLRTLELKDFKKQKWNVFLGPDEPLNHDMNVIKLMSACTKIRKHVSEVQCLFYSTLVCNNDMLIIP